ncbi:MAG: DUF1045 domain-containing protein [Rhizobiaceae bacterium]|nr:DUF1045 domain-containing protein [Rhizobiaceae bacterium]
MKPKIGQDYSRYGLYFKPKAGSALAEFEDKWFAANRPNEIIGIPKRYGLHATLKAPFKLDEQHSFDELFAAIKQLSVDFSPIYVGALAQRKIESFLALVPKSNCPDLDQLAFDCVRMIDPYRAPIEARELERRRAVSLNLEEEKMLAQWGYPYVKDSFRFHITLTGNLHEKQVENIQPELDDLLKPVLSEPLIIEDICLVGDPGEGKPFRLLERFSLTK